ncbi:MAG: hypothetical protein GY915_09660 [bacterium]|nr:hypothetical protein [bacterium]
MIQLQMKLDRMENKAATTQALDMQWLQREVEELRKENAKVRSDALEKEREAYQRGKEDAEENIPISEGFGLKDLGPILKAMGEKGKQQQEATPDPVQKPKDRQMTGEDLKNVLAMVLSKTITPKAAPELIKNIYGPSALVYVIEKKIEIFEEVAKDPELQQMANGETPELLAGLNKELENYAGS